MDYMPEAAAQALESAWQISDASLQRRDAEVFAARFLLALEAFGFRDIKEARLAVNSVVWPDMKKAPAAGQGPSTD